METIDINKTLDLEKITKAFEKRRFYPSDWQLHLLTSIEDEDFNRVKYLVELYKEVCLNNEEIVGSLVSSSFKIFKYLLRKGIDINAENDVIFKRAVEGGRFEIIKYLVERGANIHVDDDYALKFAASNNQFDNVKYLVEQGANIHTDDDFALRESLYEEYTDIAKYLIEKGANIHVNNDMALRYFAREGDLEFVKYLIEQGADIHADDDSALDWSVRYNEFEVIKYLIEQAYLSNYEILFKYNVLKQYVEVLQNIMDKVEFKVIYQDEEITFHSLKLLSKISTFFKSMMENESKCHIIKNEEEWNAFKRMFCEFKFKKSDDYWHKYYHVGEYFQRV